MKTNIQIQCIDQTLMITNEPVIACGGVNEDTVTFEFCPMWDGLAKTATFYTDKEPENVYEILLQNDSCVIPHEVLTCEGILNIGVRGVEGEIVVRTSENIKYKIVKGAPRGTNTAVEPTPDVYQIMLANTEEAKSTANGAKSTVVNLMDLFFHDGVLRTSDDSNPLLISPVEGEYKYKSEHGHVFIKGRCELFPETTWTPKSLASEHYEVIGYRLNIRTGDIEAKQWTNVSVATIAGYRTIRDLTDKVNLPVRDNNTYHDVLTALILIPGGATEITADMIEDLRGNERYCGYVTSLVCTAENNASDKAPAHTYSTEDIVAGSASTEPEGTLHLVIE